ncbi:MAG: FAD-binding oxidoreductase [Betaproteobacteria bacterium]
MTGWDRTEPGVLLDALRKVLGVAGLVCDPSGMAPYLTDWRRRLRGDALCIALPSSTEQVSAVVRLCADAGVSIVPQGGNTGLCGGATPCAGDLPVVIGMRRMNRVRALDRDNGTITVEAGCLLEQVQGAASDVDRLFPLSLAAEGSCQIGGNLSTNAGGVHVLRYGNMRDLVLGLEVVLPDARVWNGLRGLRKDNTGYDLKQLFIGSEGTLGIITAAVLKLFPFPRATTSAWIGLPTPESAVGLLAAAQDALAARLSAFELVGDLPLALVLRHIDGAQAPLPARHAWHVLLEATDSDGQAALEARLVELLASLARAGRIEDATVAQSVAQARRFWHLREHIPEAQTRAGYSIKHDISLPISRIPQFLDEAAEALASRIPGLRIVPFGHLGDGNLHYNLSRPEDWKDDAFARQTTVVNRIVHDLVHASGGSISAEHGLGQVRRDEAARYRSDVERDLMLAIKRAIDPADRMNPGKVIRGE